MIYVDQRQFRPSIIAICRYVGVSCIISYFDQTEMLKTKQSGKAFDLEETITTTKVREGFTVATLLFLSSS